MFDESKFDPSAFDPSKVEAALAGLEDEVNKATSHAIATFDSLATRGVTPSKKDEDGVFVSTEVIDLMSAAMADAALMVSFRPGGEMASNVLGMSATMLDAFSRQAKGESPMDPRSKAKGMGLL